MEISSLHKKLIAGYTAENLQKITRKIIDLHRNNQVHAMTTLLHAVGDEIAEKKAQTNKAFYRLMMIYHPDRIGFYRSEIDRLYAAKDLDHLKQFSHIFTALDLEKSLVVLKKPANDAPAYSDLWEAVSEETGDYDEEYPEEEQDESLDELDGFVSRNNFFSVFKKQAYGNSKVELPFYYLEDIDVLDLAGAEIDDLDGIRYCKHLVTVELSGNRITDISELASLTMLQEVYLAGNRIGYIDALQFLPDLHAVDISFNAIDDLSPLFELEHLEYLNVTGNKIPRQQLDRLQHKGVIIIS